MKSIEVKSIQQFSIFLNLFFHIQPSLTNGGVNKPPSYPVEGATPINEPPAPDPHTTDLVSYVINLFRK